MKNPVIDPSAFIAPNTTVMGDVTVGARSSVFFGAVIRAEKSPIVIGDETNIQDNCVLHVDPGMPMTIGDGVTVGHGAILHSCTVGDNSLIGIGAIVLNEAVIGRDCIIAAGALVPPRAVIPDRSMVMGSPAKVRRQLTEDDIAANRQSADFYVREAEEYRAHLAK
ncbi:MAG: gamma carbonic anhydrase family protein [Ruminococcaceae bacterium]|nr:gamma carbonic anhydrase family protein [Oscillospiraceae bacterium]